MVLLRDSGSSQVLQMSQKLPPKGPSSAQTPGLAWDITGDKEAGHHPSAFCSRLGLVDPDTTPICHLSLLGKCLSFSGPQLWWFGYCRVFLCPGCCEGRAGAVQEPSLGRARRGLQLPGAELKLSEL